MSSPAYYDDGSFKYPLQNGPTRYALPFADKGDAVSFTATITMRGAFFQPFILMKAMVFNLGVAYLVQVGETRDVGCGLLEWDETYASVPVNRTEYGSIGYTQQLLTTEFSSANFGVQDISDFTCTRDAQMFYEYSLHKPLPRKLAPVLFNFQNRIYQRGGYGSFRTGELILAQDTTSEIYLGKIYCRKSILIEWQPGIALF